MGRNSVPTLRDGWRERLLWRSLATALIALLLFGLIALAEWGERADAAPIAGLATQIGRGLESLARTPTAGACPTMGA